jgi:septum formation protein
MESIVLASGSLRRQEYFKMLKLPFRIMPPSIDETNVNNLNAQDLTCYLAKCKVEKIIADLKGRLPLWIFAADTLLSLDGEVIGKSKDREEARQTLKRLSGRSHEVFTGCALYNGKEKKIDCRCEQSSVDFVPLSEADIEWYLDSGEWQGAAGSYKIQGMAGCFIRSIKGSFSSIVGLPLHLFYDMLTENGYPLKNL